MRLKATNVLNKAISRSGALVTLADDLSVLRAEEVETKISF